MAVAGRRRVLPVDLDRQRRGDTGAAACTLNAATGGAHLHEPGEPRSTNRGQADPDRRLRQLRAARPGPTSRSASSTCPSRSRTASATTPRRSSSARSPCATSAPPPARHRRDVLGRVAGPPPLLRGGFFNGDGPNRLNADSRYDVAGRAFVRPFATATTSPDEVGADRLLGAPELARSRPGRLRHAGAHDAEASRSGSRPTRTRSGGSIHIMPSTGAVGARRRRVVPIGNFDFTGEFVYAVDNTREAVDGYQLSPFTERLGALKGCGWYAQVGYWIVGDHDIIGYPSYGRPDSRRPDAAAASRPAGVQVLAQVRAAPLDYEGDVRGGSRRLEDPERRHQRQHRRARAQLLGHAAPARRLQLRVYNMFPDSEPVTRDHHGRPAAGASAAGGRACPAPGEGHGQRSPRQRSYAERVLCARRGPVLRDPVEGRAELLKECPGPMPSQPPIFSFNQSKRRHRRRGRSSRMRRGAPTRGSR